MSRLRYYISGHGLGHASRSCQVLTALHTTAPRLGLEVVSDAPRWFLDTNLPPGTNIIARRLDVGVCQTDSLDMDLEQTLTSCQQLLSDSQQLISEEVASLQRGQVDLVVTDVAALACQAAAEAGIPSVILSNFTWDWIYEGFLEHHPGFAEIIDWQKQAYQQAGHVFRLPFHGPLSFGQDCIDLPLVARRHQLSRAEVRDGLDLGSQKLGLLSFGGFGLTQADLSTASDLSDWVFLAEPELAAGSSILTALPNDIAYPDLVNAADVVITKPGYGIVAECIAHKTAVLYTPRGDFREQALLIDGLHRYTRATSISNRDLRRGDWAESLSKLLPSPRPDTAIATDGDHLAAEHLTRLLGTAP
jgi:L-arabinokinase